MLLLGFDNCEEDDVRFWMVVDKGVSELNDDY